MRYTAMLIALGASIASTAPAQQTETATAFEMRPMAGIFVPIGAMRDDFRSTALVGFQSGFEINDHSHVMLGGAWARTSARFPSFSVKRTELWQFDAGGELNLIEDLGWGWLFRPYVGAGGGIRTFDYADVSTGSKTCALGYASLGAEAQRRMTALRLETRANVTCFESPVTGVHSTRADLALLLGLAFHLQ